MAGLGGRGEGGWAGLGEGGGEEAVGGGESSREPAEQIGQ